MNRYQKLGSVYQSQALRKVPKGRSATWSEPAASPRFPRPGGRKPFRPRPTVTGGGIRWIT